MSRIARVTSWQVPPRWLLVEVETDDQLTGWGEAIVPKRARAVLGAIDDMADNLRGAPAGRIEEAAVRMRQGAFFRGGPILATAAAAIEQALWDIKGRRYGAPIHDLLGGAVRESTRAYAWIGGDRPDDVAEHARRRRAQGYTAVKMNATAEADHLDVAAVVDGVVARIGAVRDAVGTALDVALDCHGRVHRSILPTLLRELEPFRPMWVEEPVSPGHEDALREVVRRGSGVPIATGERLTSRWEFKRLLEDRVVDVIQPDVSLTGVLELRKIAAMAEAYDVAVAPHCPNGPVSQAATLQVGACAPNVVIQEHSVGLHYHTGYGGLEPAEPGDYLRDPTLLDARGGYLRRLDGPGLGVEIDRDLVRARARVWQVRDPEWRLPDGRITEW
jgi:galactonate dehydratase